MKPVVVIKRRSARPSPSCAVAPLVPPGSRRTRLPRGKSEQAEALREYMLHDLHLDRAQVDELYTCVKKGGKRSALVRSRRLSRPQVVSKPSDRTSGRPNVVSIHPFGATQPTFGLPPERLQKEKNSQGHVVGVRRRMVFGSVAEMRARFKETPLHQLLTTDHIERDNLTSRTHNSRLVRQSITYSKARSPLQ